MFNDICCETKGNEKECLPHAKVVSLFARKFGTWHWSFIGPGFEKKWYSIEENSPQGIWHHIADKMLLEFAESGCPIFRATTPFSRWKLRSKEHGELSIHFTADYPTIWDFRIIVSANQLSLYGAVANMCEEFESLPDRSGESDVLVGQSIVLSEMKAEVLLENDIPSNENLLLQRFEERIELLSQGNKVSKFSMDSGFIHVVEIGQYFMTKDTEEQFFARACRGYTLPRNDESSQPKGWIQGSTKIGPVLEVTTSCLYGKHVVEIRIWSLSEDNSQSWVKISHGSHQIRHWFKLQQHRSSCRCTWSTSVTTDCEGWCSEIKGKSKTTKMRTCWFAEHHSDEWKKLDWYWSRRIFSLSAYEISKKVINLFRHSQTVQREDDGAVQFWRVKKFLQNQIPEIS